MTRHGALPPRRELLHQDLTDRILNAFYQVYHELGFGFAESIYAAAMEIVLTEMGLRVQREVLIEVWFRGRVLGRYRADMVVENTVMLEFKSMRRPDPSFEAQTLHYLRSTPLEVSLILYFNPKPLAKRLVFTNDRKFLPTKSE